MPDPNHDWNSFAIEEIEVGTWAICKLKDQNNNLFSQYFAEKDSLGIPSVVVQILAVDAASNSVLVIYNDYHNLQKVDFGTTQIH